MLRKLIAAVGFAMLAFAVPSHAQPVKIVATCGVVSPAFATTTTSGVLVMDVNGLLCTAASVSASITGFPTVQSTGTPISVTTSSATGTLPTGAVVVASNVGATNGAYCKLGASATTSDQLIPPNSWFAFTVGANTQLSCITSTSTTTVNMVGGSGLPTGSGGGGGGGGGGGAITAASGSIASGAMAAGSHAAGSGVDGWDLTQGAIADAVVAAGATGSVSAKLRAISRDVMTTNTWAGGTLGAMAAYGTSPGAVLAPGVNAFVTNTQPPGQAAMAASSPVVIASNQTANALWGHGATGAAVPANATYMAFNSGGNLTAPSIAAPLPVNQAGPYPIGAVPYTATATGTTGATTATLAGAASVTTYICGFSIRANATAAATGNATVTGVITATLNFTQWTAPNASGLGVTEMIFSPCVPASAANTSIAVVSAAPGTGGVVSVTSWGYKL